MGAWATGWDGWAVRAAVALLVVAVAGGCVGSVTPREVADEARARGGGLSGDVVLDALAAVAAQLALGDDEVDGAADVRIQSITVTLAHVVLEVAAPGESDELASFRYGTGTGFGGHGLADPVPVARTTTAPPLDTTVFTLADVRLGRLDELVDGAIAASGLDHAYAALATVARPAPGTAPVVEVTVTDRRATVEVTSPVAVEATP